MIIRDIINLMPSLFSVKIVGPAGTGVMSIGETLLRSFVREGFYALGYPEYPSLIKGGHNTFLITLSDYPFFNNAAAIDILIPLTQSALDLEKNNLSPKTLVVPILTDVATKAGNLLTLNTAALGYLVCLLHLDSTTILNEILANFEGKSSEVLDQNKTAFTLACDLSTGSATQPILPAKNNTAHTLVISGNEAVGVGAIAAGLDFFAAYPMTPSTTLLTYLAENQASHHYLCRQAEDEIGAINMAIGASYTGARSMVGTAGGGFALMQESISLSGMQELPLVIFVASRPGPATGLPTWTSQADLLFTIFSGHGEFCKVVLTPSDPQECFNLTYEAFRLSQYFHIPVVILSDKYLAENLYSTLPFPKVTEIPANFISNLPPSDLLFPRYDATSSGIHPRSVPGVEFGQYVCNSDEHNSSGLDDDTLENRTLQNRRRSDKMKSISSLVKLPPITGKGDNLIISWGSTKQIVAEVAVETGSSHLHFNCVWPLPYNLSETLIAYKRLIVVENNNTHQFSRLLAGETGVKPDLSLGSDTGRPLDTLNLINQITNIK